MEEKKSKKKTVIIVVVCIAALILAAALYCWHLVQSEKANMEAIRLSNEKCFLAMEEKEEYGLELSYDDLLAKLLASDKLEKGTQVKLSINDKELKKGESYKFDKVGAYTVDVELTNDYTYRVIIELSDQIKASKQYKIEVEDTVFPEISGAEDKEITVGDTFDALEGIKASDKVDGELEVKSEGTVDTKKAGEYRIKVSATDKNGNLTEKEFKVTVKTKAAAAAYTSGGSSGSKGSSSSKSSGSSGGFTSALRKGGYSASDKDAAKKDQQARAVAQKIASDIKAKGYKTDLENVRAAAETVAGYYNRGVHVESGVDYRTPYGVLVKGEASCAGCTRALILVLSYMGYNNTTHANENEWTHQWVILKMDGKKGFADGQVGMADYGSHPLA